MKFQHAIYTLSWWYWQIVFLPVRRWTQYEWQTLPFSKLQLKLPSLIYFGIKYLVSCIWKLKKENPASHHLYEYRLFFFFPYLNGSQAISNLCQNKDFYMAILCIINLCSVPLIHITSHADFRRTTHRSESYSAYGVLNSCPRSIMFLEEAVSLHFFFLALGRKLNRECKLS